MGLPLNGAELEAAIRNEVVAQHRFFVEWYQGRLDLASFSTFEESLRPSFRMVTPKGVMLDRDAALRFVAGNRASSGDEFNIVIEDVRLACRSGELSVATYVEVQIRGSSQTRRIATAVFSSDTERESGLVWEHLHETWAA